MNLIRSINWILTYKCNLRCAHCDIWRRGLDRGISLAGIENVLSDPLVKKSYRHYGTSFDISLGGGEPFLLGHLQQAVDAIERRLPGSFKSITTNGFCTTAIMEFVRTNRKLDFKMNISIDGIGSVHDRIRGVDGCFKAVVNNIMNIRKIRGDQKIELKLTVTPENCGQIIKVHKLAKHLKCAFSFKPAENLKNYTNKIADIDLSFGREQLCQIRDQAFAVSDDMERQGKVRLARFFRDIPFYLYSKKRKQGCAVLENDITIMPDGRLYTCLMMPPKGSLKKGGLQRALNSGSGKAGECPSCMLMCGSFKEYSDGYEQSKTANVETTARCNLDCKICTQSELRKEGLKDMSEMVFKKIIEKNPAIAHVSFVGGEPFLNKNSFKFMSFLDQKGITYEITTNGTLIDKEAAQRLKDCAGLKKINYSLDGTQCYHDLQRGDGVFIKCIEAIALTKRNFNVSVSSVLKNDNPQEILKLSKYLTGLGIKNHKLIYGMSIDKNARSSSKRLMPSLKLQGPCFKERFKDIRVFQKLNFRLSQDSPGSALNIEFEPNIMKQFPALFLSGSFPPGSTRCRQLAQYRYDSRGRRIICEFIRDGFTAGKAQRLAKNLLPVCKRCCKLELRNNSDEER